MGRVAVHVVYMTMVQYEVSNNTSHFYLTHYICNVSNKHRATNGSLADHLFETAISY
jgi:hypothetical protein